MADVITNMKVRFGADTKNFKKGLDEGKQSLKSFGNDGGKALESFANQFGVSLGPLKGAVDKISTAFTGFNASLKSAGAGAGFFTKAMKLLKTALISTGIGALVVLIGSVITAFSRFQDQNDKLSAKLAGLKAVVNVVLDRIGRLGEAVLNLLKGDFKAAADSLKQAFEGVGEEMLNEYNIAVRIKELLLDLERRSKLFEAEKESAFSEINNLRALSKDKLANDQERLKAIIEAGKIEERIAEKSLRLAEEELAASLDSLNAERDKLQLSEEGVDLIERIRKGQIGSLEAQEIAKNLTLDDANAKETLFNLVDKIVAREKEQQQIIQTRLRIQNAENTVRQEIMNKEIASLNSQAKLREEMAKDETLNFEERKKLIEESSALQEKALKTALDGNKIDREQYLAESLILAREVKNEVEKLSQEIEAKYDEIRKKREQEQGDIGKPLESIGLDVSLEVPELETEKLLGKLKPALDEAKSVILDFSDVFNDTFSDLAYNFGEQMGNILAGTGSFNDFGKIILGSLGDLAIKIGKMAISTGLAVAGIKKALQSMNPYVAIAAGAALVALGFAIKSSLSKAASGTGGGGSGINENSYVFDTRGASSGFGNTTPALQAQMQTVNVNVTGEFRQRGTELVATISETNKRASYR